MNATETEQAGIETAVAADCVEPGPSSTREQLDRQPGPLWEIC
jgi:hypothetical protein